MDSLVPAQRIEKRIFVLRGQKVMLSMNLAELYGVEPRVLVQAVKRNIERFPGDFMVQFYDAQFKVVFDAIRELMEPPPSRKPQIGFRVESGR